MFEVVAGGKDPAAADLKASAGKLRERKFALTFREVPAMGNEYLDRPASAELVRWIDAVYAI